MNPAILSIAGFVSSNAPELVGIILPGIVEFINKDVRNETEKYLVTMAICVLLGFLFHANEIVSGEVSGFVNTTTLIFTEAYMVFKLWFKTSWLRKKIVNTLRQDEILVPNRVVKNNPELLNP